MSKISPQRGPQPQRGRGRSPQQPPKPAKISPPSAPSNPPNPASQEKNSRKKSNFEKKRYDARRPPKNERKTCFFGGRLASYRYFFKIVIFPGTFSWEGGPDPQPHTPQAPSARPLRPPSPPGPQPLSGSMAPWRCGSVPLWLRGSRQFVVCFLKGKQTRETRIPLFIGLGFLSENRKTEKRVKHNVLWTSSPLTDTQVDKQSTKKLVQPCNHLRLCRFAAALIDSFG